MIINYLITRSTGTKVDLDGFNKIIDYLLTFVGEVEVKKNSNREAIISYTDTPITATLTMKSVDDNVDTAINDQITLTCHESDDVSVNLIKNVSKNIGLRIFNPQTGSFLVNDPNLLDLTSYKLDLKISKLILSQKMKPLFKYNGSLVIFATDKNGQIHLINRHLIEYLINNPSVKFEKDEFSKIVARDVGIFVALCDRGMMPISYHKYLDTEAKVTNLNGINIDKLYTNVIASIIYFNYDYLNQSFIQTENPNLSPKINIEKGQSLIKYIKMELKNGGAKEFLGVKVAQDVGYVKNIKNGLVPELSISVFLDS